MDISATKLGNSRRILIIGDAGAGKTTIAKQLGHRLNTPVYSTDDILWQNKFTQLRNRDEAIQLMKDIYLKDRWIVEGTTRDLVRPGIDRADTILFLSFRNTLQQYKNLVRRSSQRKNETTWSLAKLLWHITKKRFFSQEQTLLEMVQDHPRVITLFYPVNTIE